MTNSIYRRTQEHTKSNGSYHSTKYNTKRLVYIEHHDNPIDAITREKQLKKWYRKWKIEIIEKDNPLRLDLSDKIE